MGPQGEHMIILHVEKAFQVAPAEAAAAVDEEGGARSCCDSCRIFFYNARKLALFSTLE